MDQDLTSLITIARRHAGPPGDTVPRLSVTMREHPTELGAMIYDPVVCLVLQGAKRVFIGDETIDYGPGDYMIVGAEVAALAQIATATPDSPYLALNLDLDPAVITDLLLDMARATVPLMPTGYGISKAGSQLLRAWRNLAELLDQPTGTHLEVLHREQELLLRLLMTPQGALLREIGGPEGRLDQIRQAMAWIRDNHAKHLSVEEMARIAGMSLSVFHRRFKSVAGLTPLQYQKHIRLHEARRRLIAENSEAASIAYAVGYESASQFSREYKRLFGRPPRQDADLRRAEISASVRPPASCA